MGRASLLVRQWQEEPWGYPQRPQAAILSLKFPTGVKNQPLLTRTYRLLFAIGWSFWVFYSALDGPMPNPEWCIYVTDWSAAVMGGYTVAALLSTLWPRISWLDAAAWFLHGIAAPLAIMVTVLYWATSEPGAENDVVSWHLHLANALLMIMDVALFSRYPYNLKHFPAPLAFILAYLIFNISYTVTTGHVVYPSLNYAANLPFAIGMIGATLFLLLPATHLLLWRLDLATFALSAHRKRRRALRVVAEEVAAAAAAGDVPVKKGKAGALDDESPLKNAMLARRWLPEEGEEDEQVQTPSTGGSAAASDAGDVEVAVSPKAPAGVVGA